MVTKKRFLKMISCTCITALVLSAFPSTYQTSVLAKETDNIITDTEAALNLPDNDYDDYDDYNDNYDNDNDNYDDDDYYDDGDDDYDDDNYDDDNDYDDDDYDYDNDDYDDDDDDNYDYDDDDDDDEPYLTVYSSELSLYAGENSLIKYDSSELPSFTSANNKIATVDSEGHVTGKSAGSTKITVSLDGFTETVKIKVNAPYFVINDKKCTSTITVLAGSYFYYDTVGANPENIQSSNNKIARFETMNDFPVIYTKKAGNVSFTIKGTKIKLNIKIVDSPKFTVTSASFKSKGKKQKQLSVIIKSSDKKNIKITGVTFCKAWDVGFDTPYIIDTNKNLKSKKTLSLSSTVKKSDNSFNVKKSPETVGVCVKYNNFITSKFFTYKSSKKKYIEEIQFCQPKV